MSTKSICAICAWRENCQKKFQVSGRDMRCPDFLKDITIKEKKENEAKDKEKGKK